MRIKPIIICVVILISLPSRAAIAAVQHKAIAATSTAVTLAVTVTSTGSNNVMLVGTLNNGTRRSKNPWHSETVTDSAAKGG